MHRRPILLPLLAPLLLPALAPSSASGQDYYADIRPILVQNCMGCHRDGGPGWSMEDPAETYRRQVMIASMILDRRMPPWLAEPGHQEYVDDLSLRDYVLELVRRWQDADYPEGEPWPDPAPGVVHGTAHGGGSHEFASDLALEMLPGQAYLPVQERPDDYRCFVVDWPGERPQYVTGFRAHPGNLAVAHHVVVYSVEPRLAERFRELEAAEEGPGYQCFGGALPDRLGRSDERFAYEARYPDGVRELDRGHFWLAHWAPGMDGHRFPEGTGIRMDPGAVLVLQMHYYSRHAPGERDAGTRVDFQLADRVERPALHFAQTFAPWLNSGQNRSMVVPPGGTSTYETADDLASLIPLVARVTGVDASRIQGLEIHSVNLHMHAFGHSGRVSLRDRTGRKETLLSVPRWDLRWQRDFTFREAKVFRRQDLQRTVLSVECTFRNPTDQVVVGGYGSFDEMCFNFAYIAVQVEEAGAGAAPQGGSRPE